MSFLLSGDNNTVIGYGARPPASNSNNTVSIGSSTSRVYLAGATDTQGVSSTNTALYLTGTSLNIDGSAGTAGQVLTRVGGGIQWVTPPVQNAVVVSANLAPTAPLAPLYVCTSPGYDPITLTLPAPNTAAGAVVQVKNLATYASFTVTSTALIVPIGGTTASAPDPLGTGGNCTLACDGINWYLMDLTAGTPVPSYYPSAPGSVAITVTPGVTPRSDSMTVTWTAPSSSGPTALDYYTVSIFQGGALVTSGTVAAPTLTKTLTGPFNLTSTDLFYATVTATNLIPLTGPAGQSINYTWAVVPAPPDGISIAVPATDTPSVLAVSWTPPPVAVLPLTGYNVLIYQGTTTLVGQALGVSPSVNTFNVPSLSSTYNLATVLLPISAQVNAINAYGAGAVAASSGYAWYDPVISGNTPLVCNGESYDEGNCDSITGTWTAPQVYTPTATVTVRLQNNQSGSESINILSPSLPIGTTSYQFNPPPPATKIYVGKFVIPEIRWTFTVTVSTGPTAIRGGIDLTLYGG